MGHLGRLLQPEKLLGMALAISCAHAHALGFGDLILHSHLGTPLSASVKLSGIDAENASNLCPRSRLESLDGRLLSMPQSTLSRKGDDGEILIRGRENIDEPAATLRVEIGCNATVRREFAILLDPASGQAASASGLGQSQDASTANIRIKPVNASSPRARNAAAASMKRQVMPWEKARESAKNVLRLSVTAEATTQEGLAAPAPRLKFSDTLSEPRAESDPARREAMRADQARVAALLRGEDPYRAAESRMREVQAREQAMLREATLARQQSAADRQALEDEQRKHQSNTWIAGLAFALLALGISLAWLRRRSASDSRMAQASFLNSLNVDLPIASEPASSVRQEAQPIQPPYAAEMAARHVASSILVPVSEPDLALAIPEISRKKEVDPLEFGLVWHESNDTILSPTETPIATASPETGNSLDWLSAAEPAAAAGMENDEAAAQVSELLLAVETWMDDHNPLRAIALLEPACAREQQLSPAPMRYLLELYRIVGEDEKHRTTQEACLAQFPLALPESAASRTQEFARPALADYPEILADIENLRDGAGLLSYLQNLLLRKEGFEFPVYRDIMRRIAEAEEMRRERDIADMSLSLDHG